MTTAVVTLSADSIALVRTPALDYLLRIADTLLIHAQRLSEWCGHAPILEEDIALSNLSLDLLGQARAMLTLAGRVSGQGLDEDQLAFLRGERDFLNATLAELPGRRAGFDFADAVLRNLLLAVWFKALWSALVRSTDADLAAIASKSLKETRYHVEHAADWVVRLGDGTDESARRMAQALQRLWPYTTELFEADAVDAHAQAGGLGPAFDTLHAAWAADLAPVLARARLTPPPDTAFRSTGRSGVHSEHLGYLLAEMQHLQRAFPGGRW